MVEKGQILERPALIPCGEDLWLDGLYHRGERKPSLLVCPPYLDDGGIEAPCVAELAFAAAKAGHPSLRFSHRGRGASQGEFDPKKTIEDAEAAWRFLAEGDGPRIAIAGYRSGCATAISLARLNRRTRHVVLVAPSELPPDLASAQSLRVLVLLTELDQEKLLEPWRKVLEPIEGRAELVEGADVRIFRGLPIIGDRTVEWIESAAEIDPRLRALEDDT
jgi:uncharacterized protein